MSIHLRPSPVPPAATRSADGISQRIDRSSGALLQPMLVSSLAQHPGDLGLEPMAE